MFREFDNENIGFIECMIDYIKLIKLLVDRGYLIGMPKNYTIDLSYREDEWEPEYHMDLDSITDILPFFKFSHVNADMEGYDFLEHITCEETGIENVLEISITEHYVDLYIEYLVKNDITDDAFVIDVAELIEVNYYAIGDYECHETFYDMDEDKIKIVVTDCRFIDYEFYEKLFCIFDYCKRRCNELCLEA